MYAACAAIVVTREGDASGAGSRICNESYANAEESERRAIELAIPGKSGLYDRPVD